MMFEMPGSEPIETIPVIPRSRHAASRASWPSTPPSCPVVAALYPAVSTSEAPTSKQACMTRRLSSGKVAFTTTSASPRTRRSACGSVTSASIAWIAAVFPRDFKARERSPRLSAITISSTRGSDASSRVMILPSPPVPRTAACTANRSGRRALEVSTLIFGLGPHGPRPGRPGRPDEGQVANSLRARVHVEPIPARESDQRHPEFLGDGDREARGGADRDDEGDGGDRGLLQNLKTGPAAHREDGLGEGDPASEERLPHDLVDRVVSADVLTKGEELPSGIEQSCGMQSARLREPGLALAELFRDRRDHRGIDRRSVLSDPVAHGHPDGLQRSLAADAAGRRHVEMSRETVRVKFHGGP